MRRGASIIAAHTTSIPEAPGTSRYHTKKNVRNVTGRIERKKYNSTLRKVTVHKEKK